MVDRSFYVFLGFAEVFSVALLLLYLESLRRERAWREDRHAAATAVPTTPAHSTHHPTAHPFSAKPASHATTNGTPPVGGITVNVRPVPVRPATAAASAATAAPATSLAIEDDHHHPPSVSHPTEHLVAPPVAAVAAHPIPHPTLSPRGGAVKASRPATAAASAPSGTPGRLGRRDFPYYSRRLGVVMSSLLIIMGFDNYGAVGVFPPPIPDLFGAASLFAGDASASIWIYYTVSVVYIKSQRAVPTWITAAVYTFPPLFWVLMTAPLLASQFMDRYWPIGLYDIAFAAMLDCYAVFIIGCFFALRRVLATHLENVSSNSPDIDVSYLRSAIRTLTLFTWAYVPVAGLMTALLLIRAKFHFTVSLPEQSPKQPPPEKWADMYSTTAIFLCAYILIFLLWWYAFPPPPPSRSSENSASSPPTIPGRRVLSPPGGGAGIRLPVSIHPSPQSPGTLNGMLQPPLPHADDTGAASVVATNGDSDHVIVVVTPPAVPVPSTRLDGVLPVS